MNCRVIKTDTGGSIVCGSPRGQHCKYCGAASNRLCDWPVKRAGEEATCDIPMCSNCAMRVGPDKDYCRPHFKMSGEAQSEMPKNSPVDPKWIKAKFDSSCSECGDAIEAGQKILWAKGQDRSTVWCGPCGERIEEGAAL